jgi:hypothetical protein
MTLINILGDGTVYPPLRQQDLVIRYLEGQINIGRFDRFRFMSESNNYLNEPANAADLKADAIAYINAEMPGLFGKRQVVHIVCPQAISAKADWCNS